MIEPSINKLMEKVDSKYTLVVAVAKRARQLTDGSEKLTHINSDKPVTVATNELCERKITYMRNKK